MTDTAPAAERAVGDIEADAFLHAVEHHMHGLVGRHAGTVADAARRSIAAGGKRMRPLLVAAARPHAGTRLHQDDPAFRALVRAGAAIELVHTASLVHDDQLDGATLRRGVPTVHATDGRATSTATGDLLFSLAFATLAQVRDEVPVEVAAAATSVLARTACELAEGEAMQAGQWRSTTLSREAYEHRCELKTGVLFAAALELGGILGAASDADVRTLGEFGRRVGVAFQIADDVLDCGEPSVESVLGKRPGADVRDGTITLPMLEALADDAALAETLAGDVAESDVESVLARIRRTGALDRARQRALTLRDEAVELLCRLDGAYDVPPLAAVATRAVQRIA